jgi:competence protein ComEC
MADTILKKYWLRKRMHISWHIAWASIGVLIGVALATLAGNLFVYWGWLLVAGSLVSVAFIRQIRYLALIALIGGAVIGLWRGSAQHEALRSYVAYYDKVVHIRGTVSEDTSFGPKGDQRLRISDVSINGKGLPGVLWVSTDSEVTIKRGDMVELSGALSEGFGNIPASMFRAHVDSAQRPYPGDVGRRVRDWFAVGVERAIPGDDAQFALAYLVGQKLNMSNNLNDQLKAVGLIHAVVASGAHLTILVGVVRRLFIRVSKYLTAIASLGMITSFIMITGFSPSMTRAGLVSVIGLAAWYYGRVIHPLVLLSFAAALTVIYNPAYIWGDVGWYLSFAAFAGVLILGPLFHHYFWGKNKQPSILREVLVATIAAQLITMPIVIYVFGYYSVYALLANVLVVPLIPLTMLLTFVSGVVGLLLPNVAAWFGIPVNLILEYMKAVINWLANLPGARNEITFGMPVVIISYLGIAAIAVYIWRATRHNFRTDTAVQRDF